MSIGGNKNGNNFSKKLNSKEMVRAFGCYVTETYREMGMVDGSI